MKFIAATVAFSALAAATSSNATTELFYVSSPLSVGAGQTMSVTPAMGFSFSILPTVDNSLLFSINNFATLPNPSGPLWWQLAFAAPGGAPLSVGDFQGATRWPFQAPTDPGLSFVVNSSGNNTLTGSFTVLDVSFSADGQLMRFAADFTQYDEGIAAWWTRGAIRFNSDIPITAVPEPSSAALFLLGVAALVTASSIRTRRRSISTRVERCV
jgi:hypothetical protein